MNVTPDEVLRHIEEYASEYLEEVDEPRDLLLAIMSHRLATALNHIEYLQGRLKNASTASRCN